MEETGLTVKDVQFLTATTSILADCNKQYVTIWMTAVNAKWPGSEHLAEPKVRRIPTPIGEIRSLTILIAS